MMNDEKYKVIPNGSLFVVTYGEYSDYMVLELYRANRELVPATLEKEYLDHVSGKPDPSSFEFGSVFLNWLEQTDYVTAVNDWTELHIGEYGDADIRNYTPPRFHKRNKENGQWTF